MTYEEAYNALQGNLIYAWANHPVEDVLRYMREYSERWGSGSSAIPWQQAYIFITESEEREAVFKFWFITKMIPKKT